MREVQRVVSHDPMEAPGTRPTASRPALRTARAWFLVAVLAVVGLGCGGGDDTADVVGDGAAAATEEQTADEAADEQVPGGGDDAAAEVGEVCAAVGTDLVEAVIGPGASDGVALVSPIGGVGCSWRSADGTSLLGATELPVGILDVTTADLFEMFGATADDFGHEGKQTTAVDERTTIFVVVGHPDYDPSRDASAGLGPIAGAVRQR